MHRFLVLVPESGWKIRVLVSRCQPERSGGRRPGSVLSDVKATRHLRLTRQHRVDIAAQDRGDEISPLWWALSVGANLGGNLRIVGASADVLVTDMARNAGYPISFTQLLK